MKSVKRIVLFTIVSLLLLCGVAMAESVDDLPADVRAYFLQKSMSDITVLDTVNGYELGGSDACYFVLTRNAKMVNTLYAFKWEGPGWKFAFATNSAVPQTNHTITIDIAYSGEEWPTGEHFETPQLYISQINAGEEYPELNLSFQLTNGRWLLHRVWSYIGYESMLIKEDAISYYADVESATIVGTVYGTFQRDLRHFSLSALPKTLKKARARITSAHVLPQGDLKASKIQFAGGKKYPVYTAPDQRAFRSGSGKAAVSTNGWIQVFGREGDWIMIQYSIDSGHYRIGYISAKALPKKAAVPELYFQGKPAWMGTAAEFTDDPLFSCASLHPGVLDAQTAITWLATMDKWAYIEYGGTNGTQRTRGFVPAATVTLLSIDEVKGIALQALETALSENGNHSEAALIPAFQITATYDQNTTSWRVCLSNATQTFTVIVDDRTQSTWLEDWDHG